jgi:hypothetical protein
METDTHFLYLLQFLVWPLSEKYISTFSIPIIVSFDNDQHSYPYKTRNRLAFKESQHSVFRG